MKWFGYTFAPHERPMEKYLGVKEYIDEESRGDVYDIEATAVSEPFEASNRKEAFFKYKEILKGIKWRDLLI